jgi:hypothetical protein
MAIAISTSSKLSVPLIDAGSNMPYRVEGLVLGIL